MFEIDDDLGRVLDGVGGGVAVFVAEGVRGCVSEDRCEIDIVQTCVPEEEAV